MKNFKVLHTADWHIGSFKGPEKDGVNLRSEDTMNCLRHLVKVAQDEKPDLVLVSGDIFHQAEIWQGRSHKEVLQARGIILELSKVAGHVIVMRGTPNHDSEEAFEELAAHFEFNDHVSVITKPGMVSSPYFDIAVVPGFDRGAFRAAHPGISKEEENIIFSDELGQIVAGMKAMCGGNRASILMSHYTVPGCNTESGQTQFLTQFEPVITQDMLMAADYDLVALGHIHRPQKIQGLGLLYDYGDVETEETANLVNVAILAIVETAETAETGGEMKIAMSIDFWQSIYLDGSYLLDGSATLEYERQYNTAAVAITTGIETSEDLAASLTTSRNLHYCDGSVILDGSTLLNSFIEKEEI